MYKTIVNFKSLSQYRKNFRRRFYMKNKMALSLFILVIVFLFNSCGEASKNPGVDTVSLFDGSEKQQRFLARPDSSVMINPNSYSKSAEIGKMGDTALNLALVDNTGEAPVIKAQSDDVLFFLEDNTSNGKGGNTIFKADLAALTNLKCDEKVVKYSCNGTDISFCVYDNGTNTASYWAPLNFTKDLKCNFSKQVMCFLNITSCGESCSLKFTPSGKTEVAVKPDGKTEGFLSFNLNELLGIQDKGKSSNISMAFFAIGFDKYVKFDRFDIVEYDSGMHFSGSDKPALVSWIPYSIKMQALYPNGLNMETTDYIVGTNGIVRNYKAVAGGYCILAGKYDGNVSYDKATGIIIEGKASSSVIVSKRKVAPIYYATEADLIAKTNGSETPLGTTGYWSMNIGNLAAEDESRIAVYLGATVDEVKGYAENSKADMNIIEKDTFIEENTLYWDSYISSNVLPSPYIINLPIAE